jgi:sugar lactone lactonase YvrE
MVVLPDHSLIIAEQGKNRLVRYDLTTHMLTLLLQLENTTGRLGVDGIALDAHDPLSVTLIIPDSPNGRVLRANLDGELLGVIAQGLARPTSAAVEKDGSILITDENANALKRIRPNGAIELIAALPTPDDVIVDDKGVIYVNALGDGTIHRFVPGVMKDEAWVTGLSGPQGIVFDRAGNVVVTDTGHRRLISIIP